MKLLGFFQDDTAPEIGTVYLEQIDTRNIKVDWGSVADEESSVEELTLKISHSVTDSVWDEEAGEVKEQVSVVQSTYDIGVTSTSWDGQLPIQHGSIITACVTATNDVSTLGPEPTHGVVILCSLPLSHRFAHQSLVRVPLWEVR